jgi:hypothetical protein
MKYYLQQIEERNYDNVADITKAVGLVEGGSCI